MNRAERRRLKKKSEKTPTYNFTREQLSIIAKSEFEEGLQDSKEEAINETLTLLLALPLEVLMNYYWPKTYAKKLPLFVERVLEYYNQWQDGELDLEYLRKDLWDYAGIKLVSEKEEQEGKV